VLFQKVVILPLACAMSQMAHWPAFPVPPRSTGLFPHPLGSLGLCSIVASDPVTRWVQVATVTRWVYPMASDPLGKMAIDPL